MTPTVLNGLNIVIAVIIGVYFYFRIKHKKIIFNTYDLSPICRVQLGATAGKVYLLKYKSYNSTLVTNAFEYFCFKK